MKKILFTSIVLIFALGAKAQISDIDTLSNKIYSIVDVDPQFPGGLESLYKFIALNIRYPKEALEKHQQGKVYVTFIIEKDGSVSNTTILRGVSDGIDKEAIRIVNSSPKWIPGMKNNNKVRVSYTVPITFNISPQILSYTDKILDTAKFYNVEVTPDFPGGMGKFFLYLKKNMKYSGKVKGIVTITFVVEKDGSLTDIKIKKGLSEDADAEAIRLISKSPIWIPGAQNNRPVRVLYTIPINFPVSD